VPNRPRKTGWVYTKGGSLKGWFEKKGSLVNAHDEETLKSLDYLLPRLIKKKGKSLEKWLRH